MEAVKLPSGHVQFRHSPRDEIKKRAEAQSLVQKKDLIGVQESGSRLRILEDSIVTTQKRLDEVIVATNEFAQKVQDRLDALDRRIDSPPVERKPYVAKARKPYGSGKTGRAETREEMLARMAVMREKRMAKIAAERAAAVKTESSE